MAQLFTDLADFTTSDLATTSLTAVNVPQMFFPINIGGRVWEFEFTLIIGSSSVAGLKIALTVPSGATFRAWAVGNTSSASAFLSDKMSVSGTLGAAFATVAAQGLMLTIRGGVVSGNTAGNVQLQAAKVTSGTATLSTGSFFTAKIL